MTVIIDELCENIIREVCKSNLDFQINQTPYSLYFSIRKKFVKGHKPNSAENDKSTGKETLDNIKKEYSKLYDFYQASLTTETFLKAEILRLNKESEKKIEETLHVEKQSNTKVQREIDVLKSNYDKKCCDIKALKDEIDTLKKDKNATSVALKRVKKEESETIKTHEKKIKNYEAKIVELVEFKDKKLAEERELKLKQRKELKKMLKQNADKEKPKKEEVSNVVGEEENDFNFNVPVSNKFDALLLKNSDTVPHLSVNSPSGSLSVVYTQSTPNPIDSSMVFSKSVEASSSIVASPSSKSSSSVSSPVNTYDSVSLNTNNSIAFNQKQKQQEEILAALKINSSCVDKCLEVIAKPT